MYMHISSFDLFPAMPTLRAKGEPEVTNICGGIFSIILFSCFVYLFISTTVSTVRLQRITSTETLKNVKQKREISNITFGVGFQFLDLSSMLNIFSLKISYFSFGQPPTSLPIKKCQRSDWKLLDDALYSQVKLQTPMCLDSKNNSLFGDVGSIDVRALYFQLSICDNATSSIPCAPQQLIDALFSQMIFNRYLAASMVILDTGFNPTNQTAQKYEPYMRTLMLIFNKQQYSLSEIFVGTYQVLTDISFLPNIQEKSESGYFIHSCNIMTMPTPNNSKILVEAFIVGSSVHKVIQRSFGKLDEVLSYVGGLFGIVLSFFGFFILSYNQYKYQLRVSEGAFQTKNRDLSKEQNFHFLKFIKYSVYDWLNLFFKCKPNWQDCQAIQQSREQANEQIDVKLLLQRIAHLQSVVSSGNSDREGDTVMYMVNSSSIEEAKRRRSLLQYCSKFSGTKSGITIAFLEQLQAIFQVQSSKSQSFIFQSKGALELEKFGQGMQEKNSLQIMEYFLERYHEKFTIDQKEVQLSEEDLQAEKELGHAFFLMKQKKRREIIKKIPISILYRLKKLHIGEGLASKLEVRQEKVMKERKKMLSANLVIEYNE